MTPEQAPDGVREAVEKEVKHINQKVRSKAARVNNALRNAELEVLKGQRGGKRYRKPHSKRTYQASSPGEPPARRTGALRLQWAKGVDGGSSGVVEQNIRHTSKARFRMQGIWKTVQAKWRQDRMWKKSKKRHCRK